MIYLYEGTPGSGKSYHATARIYDILRGTNVNIISNYPIDVDQVFLTRVGYLKKRITTVFPKVQFKEYNTKRPKSAKGCYVYIDNSELTVDYLKSYCDQHHKRKEITLGGTKQIIMPEDQTTVIIDEASILFNCRDWGDKKRQEWCKFFAQHRHYGFNFILITQHETMLDKQIRMLIEVYVSHKNLKYYNWFAKIVSFFAGGSVFVSLYRWQGCKDIMSKEFCRYNPRIASIYNSYMIFDSNKKQTVAADRCSPQGEEQAADTVSVLEEGINVDGIGLSTAS